MVHLRLLKSGHEQEKEAEKSGSMGDATNGGLVPNLMRRIGTNRARRNEWAEPGPWDEAMALLADGSLRTENHKDCLAIASNDRVIIAGTGSV